MNNWKRIKNKILADKEVKRIYDGLELEYKLIDEMIELRQKKCLSQKDLAEKVGTTQSALSRFESGGVSPTLRFLKKLAVALDTRLVVGFE
ncbi:helix-turn-helix transcriptional regulator [Patescibacteria group bacterium]|nr:helix-turn-helix transcriptional regulator [Patescibacteria group bacterium]MCG2701647.1 helix-turn-helix transcriptional regulator [Candidatus Parcubacteria bacterium]MBU4210859.1 helix-turn-helix transcriptional regulator [Patescibacteria group bacterium]MBU4264995.1 helix-turn-helix transcriptional regulator [Patescibacteria group bacterium]MBU4390148.1 helix-turn-helix transcriptional regulator [Patescibacteria group bacterium]